MLDTTRDAQERRTAEILERVKAVFAVKGFDGASMQDLAAGASMSVGNFYRYFPSKDAIIRALIERDLQQMQEDFAAIRSAPDPASAFRAEILKHLERKECADAALWSEIQAAGLRLPEIAELSRRVQREVSINIVDILRRISPPGQERSAEDLEDAAMLLFFLVHSMGMYLESHDGRKPDCQEMKARTRRLGKMVWRIIENEILDPAPSGPALFGTARALLAAAQ